MTQERPARDESRDQPGRLTVHDKSMLTTAIKMAGPAVVRSQAAAAFQATLLPALGRKFAFVGMKLAWYVPADQTTVSHRAATRAYQACMPQLAGRNGPHR